MASTFARILSNPFYCGYITSSLIPNKIVKGNHPPLVSETLFHKANSIVNNNPHKGIGKKQKNIAIPLKMFLKNELDGNLFTGYFKKGNYYYKTRKKGNAVNVRAEIVHNLFGEELSKYQIDNSHIPMLEKEVSAIVHLKLKQEL